MAARRAVRPWGLAVGQEWASAGALTGAFARIAKKVGLEGYHTHTARHAHATQMLKHGIHPSIVQQRLGHARVTTTLDVYSAVLPGLQEAAALRFDEGLMQAASPEPRREEAIT